MALYSPPALVLSYLGQPQLRFQGVSQTRWVVLGDPLPRTAPHVRHAPTQARRKCQVRPVAARAWRREPYPQLLWPRPARHGRHCPGAMDDTLDKVALV